VRVIVTSSSVSLSLFIVLLSVYLVYLMKPLARKVSVMRELIAAEMDTSTPVSFFRRSLYATSPAAVAVSKRTAAEGFLVLLNRYDMMSP